MATKIRNKAKLFTVPAFPSPPAEYSSSYLHNKDLVLRLYLQGVDEALKSALQYDSDDLIDGSIPNSKLENSTVSFGGVTLSLGGVDATPAFDLSDATNYPTSSLSGTITNAQLAGSIANAKLSNSTVSYGGVQLALGASDATPAFDLSDATAYPAGSLTGEIATAQIADDAVTDAKLADAINSAITANSAKVTNATHSGEVTGATALTIADGAVVTARIADDAVTGAKIAHNTITATNIGVSAVGALNMANNSVYTAAIQDDAVTSAKITGPFSSKHALFNNLTQSITSTSPVTIAEFYIPPPAGGVEATQSMTLSVKLRFQNTSSSDRTNHIWKIDPQIVSKSATGVSVGTFTFVSSPSSFNAIYKVSGDITDVIGTGLGKIGTSAAGANSSVPSDVYYEDGDTYMRIAKFPDATTVYNGVEVFYSKSSFTSPGTYMPVSSSYSQYLSMVGSSTQMYVIPLTYSFGRETTETQIRLQFDHASSITDLTTLVLGYYGFLENTV